MLAVTVRMLAGITGMPLPDDVEEMASQPATH
jgi:hypothetical protein